MVSWATQERCQSPACRQTGVEWSTANAPNKSHMYCVYVLKSQKAGGLYIGKTNNIERRLKEHNQGHTPSLKSRRPLELLEVTECSCETEARQLEKEYKKGYKREELKKKYALK